MKLTILKSWVIILFVIAVSSCTSMIECDQISKRNELFLMDVSDERLFNVIETDLTTNFPAFMKRTGLGNISACQMLKFSFAHLSAIDELNLASVSISITRAGLSNKEEQYRANPAPLVLLMQKKIKEYQELSKDPSMTVGSNIANVLLKAINQLDPEEETDIFIFSDMVENNRQLNLYRAIPENKDIPGIIKQMVEPSVMDKFSQQQKAGKMVKIIVVLKPEPGDKTNQRKIKEFWLSVFNEIKVKAVFIDNLSNSIEP